MAVGRLLVACGMNVGWTLVGRGLDAGWTCSGQVVVGQLTSSPPPVHVTTCWTFNGPHCTSQNHSSITILKYFVNRWQMNITAEF